MTERTQSAIQHLAAVLGHFYPCTDRAIIECIINTWEGEESVQGGGCLGFLISFLLVFQ